MKSEELHVVMTDTFQTSAISRDEVNMAKWIKLRDENANIISFVDLDKAMLIEYIPKKTEFFLQLYQGAKTINKQKDPAAFQQVQDYVKQTMGHDLV